MKTQNEKPTHARMSALEREIERQQDEITNLRHEIRRLSILNC